MSATRGVRAGIWTASAQGWVAAAQLIASVPLARLLGPHAFGQFGYCLFAFSFVAFLSDIGTTNGVIARPQVGRGQLAALHTASTLMSLVAAILLFLLAQPFSHLASAPDRSAVTGLTRMSALVVPMLGFQAVPRALLVRDGRFRTLALVEVCAVTGSYLTAIAIALYTNDAIALLAQLLAHTMLRAAGYAVTCGWVGLFQPAMNHHVVLAHCRWALGLYAYNNVSFMSRNVDNMLVGSGLGTNSLGLYSRASALLLAPISHVSLALTYVAVEHLSGKREDPAALNQAYLRSTQVLVLIAIPFAVSVIVLAQPIVLVLFGPAWIGGTPLVRGFALAAGFQLAASTSFWLLQACGKGARLTAIGALNALPLLAVVAGVLTRDLNVLAVTYAILGGPVLLMGVLVVVRPVSGVPMLTLARMNLRSALTGAVFGGALALSARLLPGSGVLDLLALVPSLVVLILAAHLLRPEGLEYAVAGLKRPVVSSRPAVRNGGGRL